MSAAMYQDAFNHLHVMGDVNLHQGMHATCVFQALARVITDMMAFKYNEGQHD